MKKSYKEIEKIDYLEACLAIATGFIVLFLIFKYKIFLLISLVVGICGMFIPVISKGITWLWYKLALSLGFINSKILLSLVFFLFLVPIALISRIFTKNKALKLKKTEGANTSYYSDRDHMYTSEDLENIW